MMKRVGAHCSASGGVSNAITHGNEIGAKALALFVKNQKRWHSKPIEQDEISKFNKNLENSNIDIDHIGQVFNSKQFYYRI
jgi:deoxyribonuclease-4